MEILRLTSQIRNRLSGLKPNQLFAGSLIVLAIIAVVIAQYAQPQIKSLSAPAASEQSFTVLRFTNPTEAAVGLTRGDIVKVAIENHGVADRMYMLIWSVGKTSDSLPVTVEADTSKVVEIALPEKEDGRLFIWIENSPIELHAEVY